MCTWFYADYKSLENYITRAQKSPLANEIMVTMSRNIAMTGDIRPTDVAAVIASGKSGNIGVFPMVWGFTNEASSKPIINCRIETADQKNLWRESWHTRRCVIPASWYYEWVGRNMYESFYRHDLMRYTNIEGVVTELNPPYRRLKVVKTAIPFDDIYTIELVGKNIIF